MADFIRKDLNLHKSITCPTCGCTHIIKYGKYNNIQRYKCKNPSCNHTFSTNSFSLFINSKKFKDLWRDYLYLMKKGFNIRYCAEKLEITLVTSFFWRHKILAWFDNINQSPFYNDYVEITKLSIKENFKGCRKITSKDRRPIIVLSSMDDDMNILSKPICYNCLAIRHVRQFLTSITKPTTYLNGFSDRVIAGYSKYVNNHNKRYHKNKKYIPVDNTFSLHFRRFHRRFHGIATKYLNDYLSWNIFIYKYNNVDIWIDNILNSADITYKRWLDLYCVKVGI